MIELEMISGGDILLNVVLSINQLRKNYGSFTALKGIDLQVYRGEVFGFLGPNGAGKTTTIKTCAGLLQPTSGRISICGYDLLGDSSRAKARLGYVPDDPYLYEKLTAREFALFSARLYGTKDDMLPSRVEEYFQLFEMGDDMDNLIGGYSRGMRQKTAIIAALLHRPSLLMVDEPTANLDPKSARLVKDIFQKWKEQNRTVFMSTHVMEIAENLCDRIGIIHRGELLAVDRVEAIKGAEGASLEEVFLELTGGRDAHVQKIIHGLLEGEES